MYGVVWCLMGNVWAQSSETTIDMADNAPPINGEGWTFANNVFTILDGANVIITGTNANQRRIEVAANATANITLNGVIIQNLGSNQSPLLLNNGANVILTIEKENTLTAGIGGAGIQTTNATIIIDGTGRLITAGGGNGPTGSSGGAGIGGGNNGAGGNIVINGGVVEAWGNNGAQGIGRGRGSAATGALTMNGNAIVFTNSVGDINTENKTSGILVSGNVTHWYGNDNFNLSHNITISSGQILTIGIGKTLTIPTNITLTNNGAIYNFGTINGIVSGNSPLTNSTIDLSVNNPAWAGGGWTSISNIFNNDVTYMINDGANVTITGTNTNQRRIEVAANATVNITLNGMAIINSSQSPFLLNSGANVTLTIEKENTLTAEIGGAGIQTTNATLTIGGTGSLIATGNSGGAGIGGNGNGAGGNIIINGGVITAKGRDNGIGGGSNGMGGNIIINGGIVTARGSWAGIGGGRPAGMNATGTLTMKGNAIVFTNWVSVDTENKISGILVIDHISHWYGDNNLSLSQDVIIPSDYTLTVDKGKTLTIPNGITLTNNGTIINYGEVTINGTLTNNNELFNFGTINGIVDGNTPTTVGNIDLSIDSPLPVGGGWTFNRLTNAYSIQDGANVIITGTSTSRRIEIATNATTSITLNNVVALGQRSPLLLNGGAYLTLTLEGTNRFTGELHAYVEGITVPEGATLTINGTGSLTATGGYANAGIGARGTTGNIIINSGIVMAIGGSSSAGIGGSWNGTGGNVVINGGIVTAIGGNGAQGIGRGGGDAAAGTLTMNGNAIVFASSVGDMDISRKTGGILSVDNISHWYGGDEFSLSQNVTIPSDHTIIIGENKTLTIPNGIRLTNNGTIVNYSVITIEGTLVNNGRIINFGIINGTVNGTAPITPASLTSNINLNDNSPIPAGDGWVFTNNIYTVLNDANVTITGTSENERRIIVAANATANITLKNATIFLEFQTPFLLNNGANVMLTLLETNILTGGRAGVQTTNATLTIDGTGSLIATGGDGAGIGGGDSRNDFNNGGNITINDGIVTAIGGSSSAGIGGSWNGTGGNITINGGVVTARGGSAGIGGGWNGAGGTIIITNGTVNARGGFGSAGIGGGGDSYNGNNGGNGGNITISGGSVAAIGRNGGAGIGGGISGSGGTIIISGGVVKTINDIRSPGFVERVNNLGIGGGYNGSTGTLTMNGNAIIFASNVGDMGISRKTGGILVINDDTHWYGNNEFSLSQNVTIPIDYTLTVGTDKTLIVPAGITLEIESSAMIRNNGTINNCGKIVGVITGNQPKSECGSDDISISNIQKSDNRYGIRFAQNPTSDKVEMSAILPNNKRVVETKIAIYDMTGNVVHSGASTGSATGLSWDLRNSSGRFVANGVYLVVVEVKGANGKMYQYSARLGVKR